VRGRACASRAICAASWLTRDECAPGEHLEFDQFFRKCGRLRVERRDRPRALDRGAPSKTARVWLQGKGGGLKPWQAFVLLPAKEGEDKNATAGYLSPLRQALIAVCAHTPSQSVMLQCNSAL
jgi:hypothetical protein